MQKYRSVTPILSSRRNKFWTNILVDAEEPQYQPDHALAPGILNFL